MNKIAKAALVSVSLLALSHAASAASLTSGEVTLTLLNYSAGASQGTSLGIEGLTAVTVGGGSYNSAAVGAYGLTGAALTLSGGQIAQGSASGEYAAPYGTNAQIATPYVTIYNGGSALFTLTNQAGSFGLNWGSIDTVNTLTLNLADGHSVTFNGAQIASLDSALTTEGGVNWGANGSIFANFTSTSAIKSILLASGQNSFEVSDARVSSVPIPGALVLFGSALLGLGGLRRMSIKMV